MADRAHAEALNAKADALLAQYVPLADTLYEKMATQLDVYKRQPTTVWAP